MEKDFVVRKINMNEFSMSFDETISLEQIYQICNLITVDKLINYQDIINKYEELFEELEDVSTSKI